jgi:hypothetical protein
MKTKGIKVIIVIIDFKEIVIFALEKPQRTSL